MLIISEQRLRGSLCIDFFLCILFQRYPFLIKGYQTFDSSIEINLVELTFREGVNI